MENGLTGENMKIPMQCFSAKFDLHCPRCGNTEWSDKSFGGPVVNGVRERYHKCLHCGADVRTNEHTDITIVIEDDFAEIGNPSMELIEKRMDGWEIHTDKDDINGCDAYWDCNE
jgi:hypothetical protein